MSSFDNNKIFEDDDILVINPLANDEYDDIQEHFVVISKHTNEQYQLHFQSNRFINENNESVKIVELVKRFPSLRHNVPMIKYQEFKEIIESSSYEEVEQALKNDRDLVNARYFDENENGHTELISVLWLKNFDDIKFLKMFLDYGFNVNSAIDEGGNTLLHSVVKFVYNVSIIKFLITTRGANVNVVNNEGETPLHKADQVYGLLKKLDVIKFLVEHGANIYDKNNNEGETIFAYLSDDDEKYIIKYYESLKDFNFK